MTILLIIGGWLLCWLVGAGTTFAYFQREWPEQAHAAYKADLRFAVGISAFGPFSLIVVIPKSGFWEHGWTLRRPR